MVLTNKIVEVLSATGIFFLLLFFNANIWSSIGFGVSGLFFVRFFNNIGKHLDFRDFIIIIPLLQWIIGPFLSYRYVTDDIYYFMAIEEPEYMSFAVPAIIFFSFGLFIPLSKNRIKLNLTLNRIKKKIKIYRDIDYILLFWGVLFSFLWRILPSQLAFFAFLLSNLQYVGVLFLLISNKKNKTIIFYIIIIFSIINALASAMFHLMLIWFAFLFVIIAFINKFSLLKKTIIFFIFFASLVVIQTVKHEFREIVYSEENSSSITTFGTLVSEKFDTEGAFTSEENINNMISRINQGWIIARVMAHVPKYEPYANGETIIEALNASLFPRFLNSDKKISGGRDAFIRFTGRNLEKSTSMNISVIGEAYANFGKSGIIFMFVFGLFINFSYNIILKIINKKPSLLFFIPLIYLQVIKAETDFVTVLNHLIKASIFVILVYWSFKHFFGIKL